MTDFLVWYLDHFWSVLAVAAVFDAACWLVIAALWRRRQA